MDRLFDRAFSKVHGDVSRVQGDAHARHHNEQKQDEEEAPDAIQRILKCWKDKDYFKLMGLPEPVADELGRPQWPCTATDVSKAYRKLSVLVHPDKNPGDDARAAFEALNETHRLLKDPARLEEVLKQVAGKARREREQAESRAADSEARAALVASKNAAAKRIRKQEGAAFEDTIRQQMRRRQEEAARKAAAIAKSKASALHAAEAQQGSDDDQLGDEKQHGRAAGDSSGKRRAGAGLHYHGGQEGKKDDSDEDEEEIRRAALAAAAARKRKKPSILH